MSEAPVSSVVTRWAIPLGVAWSGFMLSAWVYTNKLDARDQEMTPKLLLAFLGTPAFSVLLTLLLRLLTRRTERTPSRTGDLMIIWVSAFLFCIHASVLAAAIGMFPLDRGVPAATAILLLGLGPVLGTLEPNSAMGIRTRRTLKSESVWRKTHRAAAKMFVVAGLAGLSALFFQGRWVFVASLVPAILAVVLAIIYAARVAPDDEQAEPAGRRSDDGIR